MSEPVIKLSGVRKSYRINADDGSNKRLFRKRETEEFVVFDNVNLEVQEGEVLGIIGRNGAGKSTFLKIISEIIEPDCGTVEVKGKIASILELSMGFHNDLTGKENIILRSELYGIPRKVALERLDEIVEYSDLGKFIDNPVRTYSSGMKARLAFSVMIFVDADIFLVDEALSTGDAAFATKASEHLKNLVRNGKTVLMTSHNIRTIRSSCNRAIWLSDKTIFMDGPVDEVCDAYSKSIMESFEETLKLAEGGSSAAQYRLAGFYRHGVNVEKNMAEYRRWIEEASKRGHIPAIAEYANLLMDEDPIGNRNVALGMYKEAAEGGNFDSCKNYAYLRGNADEHLALLKDVMRRVAESGTPMDVAMYARVVSYCANTEADRKLAYLLYSDAADAGNAEAMYRKGTLLRAGIGVERSIEGAIEAFESAAKSHHPKAMIALAELYEDGRMIDKDLEKSFSWYLASAESGNTKSQYQVATMLSEGIGVEKDDEAAEAWFCRNAESALNDVRLYAVEAAQRRKVCSKEEIVTLLESASDSGYNKATSKLADMKFNGWGVSKDVDTAMDLYELSATRSLRGKVDLAKRLLEDTKRDPDKSRTFELFEHAAANGDHYAMYAIACMYRDGVGVPEDRDLYKKYTHMAADAGNKDAIQVVQKWAFKEKKRQKKEAEANKAASDKTEGE